MNHSHLLSCAHLLALILFDCGFPESPGSASWLHRMSSVYRCFRPEISSSCNSVNALSILWSKDMRSGFECLYFVHLKSICSKANGCLKFWVAALHPSNSPGVKTCSLASSVIFDCNCFSSCESLFSPRAERKCLRNFVCVCCRKGSSFAFTVAGSSVCRSLRYLGKLDLWRINLEETPAALE